MEINQDLINTKESEPIELEEKLPHLRPRLVKFCEALLNNKTQIEAYRITGYKAKNDNVAHVKAQQLLHLDTIKRYLQQRECELAEKMRERTQLTREKLVDQYLSILNVCGEQENRRNDKYLRIARETLDSLSKINGLFIDRIKIDQPIVIPEIQSMQKAKRTELIKQLEDQLPVSGRGN